MNESYKLARNSVALLDMKAEGRFLISGPNAEMALNALFSIDLEVIPSWKGCTGLFLTETATVIAIATVFKADEEFYVFTDAGAADALRQHLATEIPAHDAIFDDLSGTHEWFCVLGPRAQDMMAKCAGEEILGLPYLSFEQNDKLDVKLFRMGQCGEFEYRLLVPVERAAEIFSLLLEEGAEFDIGNAKHEAMSTLMLEMRSLAKGDLPGDADPIQSGLHWMISFRKDNLRAGEVIHTAKLAPASRSLMVRMEKPGYATDGDRLEIEGQDVGFCARVVHSLTLESDIGFAFVNPDFGYVGVSFEVKGAQGNTTALGVSAPLFVTKTILSA